MLSPESAAVVRATLSAVGGAVEDITARFYDTMFTDRPELLDGLFAATRPAANSAVPWRGPSRRSQRCSPSPRTSTRSSTST